MGEGDAVADRSEIKSASGRPMLFPPPAERFDQYALSNSKLLAWDADGYRVMKYGLAGNLKAAKQWSLSEQGWADAWAYLIEHEPKLAAAVAVQYAKDSASAAAARTAAAEKKRAEQLESEREARARAVVPGETPGTKICPKCAEEVKFAAVLCRFCGHDFEDHIVSGTRAASGSAAAHTASWIPQTSGVAVAAFICSVIGLWVAGLPLGIYAQNEIDRSEGRLIGRGFATAGIVLGLLGILATIIVIVAVVSAANNGSSYVYT